jgi:hypothetical protein
MIKLRYKIIHVSRKERSKKTKRSILEGKQMFQVNNFILGRHSVCQENAMLAVKNLTIGIYLGYSHIYIYKVQITPVGRLIVHPITNLFLNHYHPNP